MFVTVVALLTLMASSARADAPPGPYFNGFETNTSNWFDSSNGGSGSLSRQQSGYTNGGGYASGIASATDGWHARISAQACVPPAPCFGPNTRWGGYSQAFPTGGYQTEIAIYLDVVWAATHRDARFDFSSAVTNSVGGFLRDFVFNVGTNPASDSSSAGFYVNASTNATRSGAYPENPCPNPSTSPNTCRAPVHLTTSGWYTFRHTFYDDGGYLAVDFDIFDSGGGSVAHWTIHSGDAMATVGGNRYGWFANEEIPDLPIDDSARSGLNLALTPTAATNFVGTSHTVTASIASTDAPHPTAGEGVPVEFDVTSGPNMGQTSHPINTGTCSPSDCTTDSNGKVSWTYTSNGFAGTDTIRACFAERPVVVQRPPGDEARTCVTATKIWQVFSTPGKVTGGGQIQGDPVFSALGALLSVPAVMPSASGSSQATFGFVATCCSAKGNLQYEDHSAGVRIKALSIDDLAISDGTCGPNTHATFDGTASVTRAAGTTTEPFTVQADDCGEPGSTDTLGIKTTTYSNGPTTLVGGNIQIHKS